ncbi:TetR/AcrR family transcriptional regulator [Naumannella cuiyingiana]|uniref:AcrR family transcriptional regulator n=1 Tax=Naumannella cuiyingiana TaxID=1347891 RepID=A0A7Z0IKM3_9ACTN|nr:TetR family transcriptional regulator C-terminal domain-containing protein [Naumannella cuiyingiana]NYI70686.1 AcrR family transcriptional regulator [Naumannella cuiyingiana]
MPKVVDHEQRRAEIADAVRRILLRDGLAGATVRAVVAETGMSSGAIRHYFPNQEELVGFATGGIVERIRGRVTDAFDRTQRTPRARVLDICEQFLPTDEERAMELAVFADVVRQPYGARWARSSFDGIRVTTRVCVLLLAGREPRAVPGAPLRPARLERLAERLHLVIDGLGAQTTFYPGLVDAAAMRTALARVVDDVISELA